MRNIISRMHKIVWAAAGAAPLLLPAGIAAHAQDSAAVNTDGKLPEIIVTAQKRSENLQTVPIAITALTASDLTESGVNREIALIALTPNVAFTATTDTVSAYIRGVGTQYANPGLEPSVATYFDDIYSARASAGLMNYSDIDHIEVLKGPQGTLYGRNTTGGAIRIITKDPTDKLAFGGGFSFGSYGMLGGDGYLSGPITDNIQGRLSFQTDNNNGFIKVYPPGSSGRMENRHANMVRGKLKWEVTDSLTVKLGADWEHKHDHEAQAFLPIYPNGLPQTIGVAVGGQIDPTGRQYSGTFLPPYTINGGGGELRIDYVRDGYTISSISGFRESEFRGLADLDTTTAPLYGGGVNEEITRDYSQEFQAVSDGKGRLNWVVGTFIFHEYGKEDFGVFGDAITGAIGVPGAYIHTVGRESVNSVAPYGQVSYKITPEWEATVGARYTWEHKHLLGSVFGFTTTTANLGPAPNPFFQVDAGSSKFSTRMFTPKVELAYRPTDDIMIYGLFARGYKSGGFTLPSLQPTLPDTVNNEKLDDFELGWKTRFGAFQFNGAYFHYKLTNLQVEAQNPSSGVLSVTNAASQTTDGVEADFAAAVNANLTVNASIGYMNAKFDKYPNGQIYIPCASQTTPTPACVSQGGLGLDAPIGNLSGFPLPLAPKWTGNIHATYVQALPNNMGMVSLTPVLAYTDHYNQTPDGLYREPSKWLLNATASWASNDGHYQVRVYGTNLTNKRYYNFYGEFTTGGWRLPGRPREFGARLSYEY